MKNLTGLRKLPISGTTAKPVRFMAKDIFTMLALFELDTDFHRLAQIKLSSHENVIT
jgi:hypothetical protein